MRRRRRKKSERKNPTSRRGARTALRITILQPFPPNSENSGRPLSALSPAFRVSFFALLAKPGAPLSSERVRGCRRGKSRQRERATKKLSLSRKEHHLLLGSGASKRALLLLDFVVPRLSFVTVFLLFSLARFLRAHREQQKSERWAPLTGSWTRAARPGATRCVILRKLRKSIGSLVRSLFALFVPSSSSSRENSFDSSISATLSCSPPPLSLFHNTPYALIILSLQRRGGGGSKREALGILMRYVFCFRLIFFSGERRERGEEGRAKEFGSERVFLGPLVLRLPERMLSSRRALCLSRFRRHVSFDVFSSPVGGGWRIKGSEGGPRELRRNE